MNISEQICAPSRIATNTLYGQDKAPPLISWSTFAYSLSLVGLSSLSLDFE